MSKFKGTVVFDGATAEPKGYKASIDLEFNANDAGELQSINIGNKTYTIPQGGEPHLYKHTINILGHPTGSMTAVIYLQTADLITQNRDVKYPAFCLQQPTTGLESPYYLYYLFYVECKSDNTIEGMCIKRDLSDPYGSLKTATMQFNDYQDISGFTETVEQLF